LYGCHVFETAFIVDEFTPENDGYWVGLLAEEYEEIPNEMLSLTIPPHRYAIVMHEGESYDELNKWIVRHWQHSLKRKVALRITVELLDTTSGI